MARLIPSFLDDRTPPGERDVFSMLASGPDDWVVIHSLDLAPWNRGLRTEIDFLVIVPDTGILVVEVKSHERISFENDRWNPPSLKRSPFKQAADGMYAFLRRLRDLTENFRVVPVTCGCIFPRASFHLSPNLSVQPWELIDGEEFSGFRSGNDLCAAVKARMRLAIEADRNLQPMTDSLTKQKVDELVGYCIPVQKCRPDVREEIRHREIEIERVLRHQQKPVLQLCQLNERVLVSGGAGTGKTLIAMEVARRTAERGHRVALLCFNQLVGDWMKTRMANITPALPNLVVGRAIRVMAELTGVEIPAKPMDSYWECELPQLIEGRLTDPDLRETAVFDHLIIDEAQDILARPSIWECLKQFLTGGVSKGAYTLFGDFDNQNFSEAGLVDNSLKELEQSTRPAIWKLSENCRNYRIVGDTAVQLSGFQSEVYSGYMRSGGGLHNYDISFFDRVDEQVEVIAQWLREFKNQGFKASEITILTFCKPELSVAVKLINAGFKLRPAWQRGESTSYASIHAFKGMENKLVILTDIILGEPDFHRHLFYTGMTRATESVRVLCDKGSQATLLRWLAGDGKHE